MLMEKYIPSTKGEIKMVYILCILKIEEFSVWLQNLLQRGEGTLK